MPENRGWQRTWAFAALKLSGPSGDASTGPPVFERLADGIGRNEARYCVANVSGTWYNHGATKETQMTNGFESIKDAGWHCLANAGRFGFFWKDGGTVIKLFSKQNALWQFVLDENMDLSELAEIFETFEYSLEPEELHFLTEGGRSIETWLEHAPYDFERFGEVGVSC